MHPSRKKYLPNVRRPHWSGDVQNFMHLEKLRHLLSSLCKALVTNLMTESLVSALTSGSMLILVGEDSPCEMRYINVDMQARYSGRDSAVSDGVLRHV